ncbi:MAG: hypothetical protein J5789_01670 [Oscillospiraceae bacterium]|nr:hypothetical protein [Oscillospiraceae bacterium]
MRFYENALEGVKTLRMAVICSIWLLVVSTLLLFSALFEVPAFIIILGIAALVLCLAGLTLELVGVSKASRDMAVFGSAKTVLILGLVLGAVSAIFRESSVPRLLLNVVISIFSLWASVLIIQGLIAFAKFYSREDLTGDGQRLLRLVLILGGLGVLFELLDAFLPTSGVSQTLRIILSVIALVLGLCRHVMMLRYFSHVIAMLASAAPQEYGNVGKSGSGWDIGL